MKKPYQSNPLLEEIHAIRAAIAERSQNDMAKIAADARQRQRESGRQVVTLPPRRVDRSKKAS